MVDGEALKVRLSRGAQISNEDRRLWPLCTISGYDLSLGTLSPLEEVIPSCIDCAAISCLSESS